MIVDEKTHDRIKVLRIKNCGGRKEGVIVLEKWLIRTSEGEGWHPYRGRTRTLRLGIA